MGLISVVTLGADRAINGHAPKVATALVEGRDQPDPPADPQPGDIVTQPAGRSVIVWPGETGLYQASMGTQFGTRIVDFPTLALPEVPETERFKLAHSPDWKWRSPGVYVVIGGPGTGKTLLGTLVAADLETVAISIGEPESRVLGNAFSYSHLFSAIANGSLDSQGYFGPNRALVIDSIQPFAILGTTLGKGGVAKSILTGALPMLTSLATIANITIFVTLNPQLPKREIGEFTNLISGAVHGVIRTKSVRIAGDLAVISAEGSQRPARRIESLEFRLSIRDTAFLTDFGPKSITV